MSNQLTRELTAVERDEQEVSIINHYNRMIRMQEPKTKLAQMKRDEAVATRDELVARIDLARAKGNLRELALQTDVISVEEASKHQQQPTPKPGPDRN